jgi:uncharacterized membrane protein YgdD (TMEM256/DUF423 family)
MQQSAVLRSSFVLLALTVILGAFGAHGLREKLDAESLKSWNTATQYAFIHGLGIILIQWGSAAKQLDLRRTQLASGLMLLGILFFSGSIYLLTTTSLHGLAVSWLGPITPVGGLLFVAGWLMAFAATFHTKREN